MSNLSDMSGNTAVQTNKPRMDVACVIDTVHTEHISHRKCAFDELKQACSLINANLHHIQVKHSILFLMICMENELGLIEIPIYSLRN